MSDDDYRGLTRGQKNAIGMLIGLLKLAGLAALLYAIYVFVVVPFLNPGEHQDLMVFYYDLQQNHPLLLKVLICVPILLIIVWRGATSPALQAARGGKRRLRAGVAGKDEEKLDLVHTMQFDQPVDATWAQINKVFPGLRIEIGGVRSSIWRRTKSDVGHLQLYMSLSYDRMSTGQAAARPDPRVINAVAIVKDRGTTSSVQIEYAQEKMIDDKYTQPLIDESNRALKEAMYEEFRKTLYDDQL